MRNGIGVMFMIVGGLLYAIAWVVSILVAFAEGGAWGWAFIFFGATGPVGGLIEGLVWGDWSALSLAVVGLISLGIGFAISSDD